MIHGGDPEWEQPEEEEEDFVIPCYFLQGEQWSS